MPPVLPGAPAPSQTPVHALVDEIAARQERPTVRSRVAAWSDPLPRWATRAFYRAAMDFTERPRANETPLPGPNSSFREDFAAFADFVSTTPSSLEEVKEALCEADRQSILAAEADRSLSSLLGRDGAWWRSFSERQADKTWWSSAVGLWTKSGFLSDPVVVLDTDLHAALWPAAHAITDSISPEQLHDPLGSPSVVRMAVDRRGALGLPNFQPMPAFVQPAREAGWNRLSVLAHELAHTVFNGIERPFRPSGLDAPSGANSVDAADLLLLQDFFRAPNVHDMPLSANTLNEAFADVYGAMMVLESSGHDPEVIAHWEAVAAMRLSEQAQLAARGATQGDGRRTPGTKPPRWDDHSTGSALAAMLRYRAEWRGSPPADLRDLALRLASDHVVMLCHPDRMTVLSWRAASPSAAPSQPDRLSAFSSGSTETDELVQMARASESGHVWSVRDKTAHPLLVHAIRSGFSFPSIIDWDSRKNTYRLLVRACVQTLCGAEATVPSAVPQAELEKIIKHVQKQWARSRLAPNPPPMEVSSSSSLPAPNLFAKVGKRLARVRELNAFVGKALDGLSIASLSPNSPAALGPVQAVEHALRDRGARLASVLTKMAKQFPASSVQVDLVLPIRPRRPLPKALADLTYSEVSRLASAERLHPGASSIQTPLAPLLDVLGRRTLGHPDRLVDTETWNTGGIGFSGFGNSDLEPPRSSATAVNVSVLGDAAMKSWNQSRRSPSSPLVSPVTFENRPPRSGTPSSCPAGQASHPSARMR